ncbi:AraC family transcriptional regulator [Paenibacillus sp. FSL H8-0548]|uniref:AraC family transcriptional regulator n=1 Tax=Paenibacillus sp. FSL H8-0548 TaxID=1920422 RepID=UPI00096C229A|nr:helix-turn-helix domain-containing protein [Paenibacillus sp. FSL H8-0548]OMF38665.1 AraC family transcriptional regulator [Paenibacillus sp. FSL H8-0548]
MKRLPMMIQLILILFCIMVIPIFIMTWYSGTQMLKNSEAAIAESSLAGLESNRRVNESALNYLAQDTIRIASSNIFDGIRNFKTFENLNANYNRVESALSLQKELQRLSSKNDGVASAFFYLNDADYLISTDKSITLLERYETIDWIKDALTKRDGIAGVWYPREMSSGEKVISYVLSLNRLSTSTKGIIVVNLREAQIAQNMNASADNQANRFILIDEANQIISHENKNLLLHDASEIPLINELMSHDNLEGYLFQEVEGERLLYTWSRLNQFDWLYVGIYSMEKLLSKTQVIQRNMIILTAAIVVVGTILTVFLATWLSKPIRVLVQNVRAFSNLGLSGKNELVFLDVAFRRMQDEEDKLNMLLTEHEQDACSLAIYHLMRGETLNRNKTNLLLEIFPEKNFLIVLVSLDQYSAYMNKTSPETRSYHRYLFIAHCESLTSKGIHMRNVHYGDGRIAIFVNFGEAVKAHEDMLKQAIAAVSDSAYEVFGHTVTIGVSRMTESITSIHDKILEAMELIKHRIIEGSGRIFFWKPEAMSNQKYLYPLDSERRIINFLDTGDLENIIQELKTIRNQIEAAEYISYDNILFIYNQLIGVTIKHLHEKNSNSFGILADNGNIYSNIATIDTLDELEGYLKEFFYEISTSEASNRNEINYVERILAYLDQHFEEDIVFEDMAKEIGISYSYMRKLVYESTGKSLIDYINFKRIQTAKQLLIETTLNVTQISSQVGYNNIQSFNRFFRRYEGITPSSYKAAKLNV